MEKKKKEAGEDKTNGETWFTDSSWYPDFFMKRLTLIFVLKTESPDITCDKKEGIPVCTMVARKGSGPQC